MTRDRVVAAIFLLALAALALSFWNVWLLFGVAVCGLLVLGLALGFGRMRPPLAALLSGYILLLGGMAWLEHCPRMLLGLPLATALLLYGIWPMPLLAALLYALIFRSSVLPEDKLQRFLSEYGRGRQGR